MYRSKYLKKIQSKVKPFEPSIEYKEHEAAGLEALHGVSRASRTGFGLATDWAGIYGASISERPSVSAAQFKRTNQMRQLVDDQERQQQRGSGITSAMLGNIVPGSWFIKR